MTDTTSHSLLNRVGTLALVAVAAGIVLAGSQHLAFVCDDAYIAFRYVHNWLAGDGLVWNPAPFHPVEGYTSPLWVVLMGTIWRLTGVQPPVASNGTLLVFSIGSLAITAHMALRMPLRERLQRWRLALVGLVLLGTATNFTFLMWTSSGLEQGMFTCYLLAWLALVTSHRPSRLGLLAVAALASLLALTRPDGLLYVASTGLLVVLHNVRQVRGARWSPLDLLGLVPLLIIPVHVLWRRSFYGEWLPNTYYAKSVGAWPSMGGTYLGAFLIEYAFYLWIPLAILALIMLRRAPTEARGEPNAPRWTRILGWSTLGAHFAYYTVLVGGDHFEFRIYQHLVPLFMLALIWLVDRIRLPSGLAIGVAAWCIAMGWVIPWTHHLTLRDLDRVRAEGWDPHDVAPHVPIAVWHWGLLWDVCQDYMRGHFVGLRRRAHINNMKRQFSLYPTREEGLGLELPEGEISVHRAAVVGYPGWVLPEVAVVDALGLNDWVVARGKTRKTRKMAHDRIAPKGYIACFRPNVSTRKNKPLKIETRERPFTAEDVVTCEARFMEQVSGR